MVDNGVSSTTIHSTKKEHEWKTRHHIIHGKCLVAALAAALQPPIMSELNPQWPIANANVDDNTQLKTLPNSAAGTEPSASIAHTGEIAYVTNTQRHQQPLVPMENQKQQMVTKKAHQPRWW